MQAAYSEHKTLLNLLRLSDFATVIEFDDDEKRLFSTFHVYASSALALGDRRPTSSTEA